MEIHEAKEIKKKTLYVEGTEESPHKYLISRCDDRPGWEASDFDPKIIKKVLSRTESACKQINVN